MEQHNDSQHNDTPMENFTTPSLVCKLSGSTNSSSGSHLGDQGGIVETTYSGMSIPQHTSSTGNLLPNSAASPDFKNVMVSKY